MHLKIMTVANRFCLSVGLVVSLAAALAVTASSPAAATAAYGDVPAGTWYTNAVQWSVENSITDIAGPCFGPDNPVSRGETAKWIYNMSGRPRAGDRHSFTDVSDPTQHDPISWMANNGITTGKSPTAFAPDDTLTRAEAATFLHRLASKPAAPPHRFNDVVKGWQQAGVSWMAHAGITTGTSPTTFAPDATLTRAHLVTFLYRYRKMPAVTVDPSGPACDPDAEPQDTDDGTTDTDTDSENNDTDSENNDTNETTGQTSEATGATFSIRGSTLVMSGGINEGTYDDLLRAVGSRQDSIDTIQVKSVGGNVQEAIKIGIWVFDNKLDVVVDEVCFSSCADYIFPAGMNKTIKTDAIVGWHGGAQQYGHIASGLGITVEKLLGDYYDYEIQLTGETASAEDRQAYIDYILQGLPAEIAAEQAFLAKVGLNLEALLYGILPDRFEEYYLNSPIDTQGWTFPIQDMASIGFDNVTYEGPGSYPSEKGKALYPVLVFTVG